MTNITEQLNEIVRNISTKNINASIIQLNEIIDSYSKGGIIFSCDTNYYQEFALFATNKALGYNIEIANREVESLAKQGKYEEAFLKREDTISTKKDIHRRFRIEKYGTEDWFIKKSESQVLYIPTEIEVIDNLVSEYIF